MAKWKKRSSVADLPTGPKEPTSTVLSAEEEAIIVAFQRHTLLPLDDCLYALQASIPASPVAQFALPALTRTTATRPPVVERWRRPTRTGAATT